MSWEGITRQTDAHHLLEVNQESHESSLQYISAGYSKTAILEDES